MLCPKCNQPVADAARFCGSCGQPLSSAGNPDDTMIRPPPGASSGAGAPLGSDSSPGSPPGYAGAAGSSSAWASATAGSAPKIIDRIKKILLSPKTEWPVIEAEPTNVAQLYKGYVIPLAAFSAVMSFIRMSVIGLGFWRMPLITGLIYAVVSFVLALLGLYLIGLIIDGLAPTFGGQRNRRQAIKTAAYVSTVGAVSAIVSLLPGIGHLLQLLAALYGIYLLYLGLPVMMRSPPARAVGYTATVIVCTILLFVVLGLLMSLTARTTGFGAYGNPYGFHSGLTQEERQQQAAAAIGSLIAGAVNSAGRSSGASDSAAVPANGTNAQSAAAGAAAATAGLAALSGAMAGNRSVHPVDFHVLKSLLPDSLPGMQRTDAQGSSQGAMGMNTSSASGSYQGQGGTHAAVKIVDASAVAGLLNLAQSVAANSSSESDTGFEKNTTVDGRMLHEKYDNRSRHGEVTAIVAQRFTVEVTGDGVDMGTLEQYASLVDYSKLEAMKDAGLQSP